MATESTRQTHYHACNLCEAICGLETTVENGRIVSIRGDKQDPLSKGHICPKAVALKDIYNDPDRLRAPVKRTESGWQEISWKQAFDEAAEGLKKVRRRYGDDAVGTYRGNPTVHNLEAMLFGPMFFRALGTKNHYSATSVDQLPQQLAALLMLGSGFLVPVPDVDRTDLFLILGANPLVSNGSLMTAPGMKGRMAAIRERGGKVIVIDPRKTETAAAADQHLFIRPGTDAFLLLAMLNVVFSENLQKPGKLAEYTRDLDVIEKLVRDYSPERISDVTGVMPDTIRTLAREFCASQSAVCYGRIGVSTQEFGTLSHWLIAVLNIVTGNFDSPGGAMFAKPAFDVLDGSSRKSSRKKTGKRRRGFADSFSRVRKLPDFGGEFPVATLADEIETAGDGQIRALVTSAGNPVLSTPNGDRLDNALAKLDFMVSIDFYINETTRRANLILPPTSALERPHYDIAFHIFAVRNTTRFSEPVFPAGKGTRSDARIYLELARRMRTDGAVSGIRERIRKTVLLKFGSARMVDNRLKKGPYSLNLKQLRQNPHGIDLGPLEPCLPDRLFTQDKKINLAPEECLRDLDRLKAALDNGRRRSADLDLLLIGRRDLRTNNSWLHNSLRLVKGKPRCLAYVHPADAASGSIEDGDIVRVTSRVGSVDLPVFITDKIMPGVVSIPHGWGHGLDGVELSVAKDHAGINTNILTDDEFVDELSGNAALNGVPVSIARKTDKL